MKIISRMVLAAIFLSIACIVSGQESVPDEQVHQVVYGTAIAAGPFASWNVEDPVSVLYREHLHRLFTWGVTENCLKMGHIRPDYDTWRFTEADNISSWFDDNGLELKGHALVWGWQHHVPDWIGDYPVDERPAILRDHVQTVVTYFTGRINVWDVVNEPVHVTGWEDALGWETIDLCEKAFRWAHEANPLAELYINDYNILISGRDRAQYVELITELLERDVPIHGIGVQAHMGSTLPSAAIIESALDELAALGLPIDITEFDMMPPQDPWSPYIGGGAEYESWFEYQAWAYRTAYETFSSHPSVKRVFMWGFTDAYHWRPGAGILDGYTVMKPAGDALLDLLITTQPEEETE